MCGADVKGRVFACSYGTLSMCCRIGGSEVGGRFIIKMMIWLLGAAFRFCSPTMQLVGGRFVGGDPVIGIVAYICGRKTFRQRKKRYTRTHGRTSSRRGGVGRSRQPTLGTLINSHFGHRFVCRSASVIFCSHHASLIMDFR